MMFLLFFVFSDFRNFLMNVGDIVKKKKKFNKKYFYDFLKFIEIISVLF